MKILVTGGNGFIGLNFIHAALRNNIHVTCIDNLCYSTKLNIDDKAHKDLRRARACGESLIPTSSGSTTAIMTIFPELQGKLDGLAVRVPLLSGSLVDLVIETEKETRNEAVQ